MDDGMFLYPRSLALELGTTSGLALLVAQVIVNVLVDCLCCAHGGRVIQSSRYFKMHCIEFRLHHCIKAV
jgi:hypothetical protein